jgi:GT2 family glycosyltransferase
VVVVRRIDDQATRGVLARAARSAVPLRPVEIAAKGAVAAYNAGLDAARGEIIAICDDDSAPRRDWLRRIEAAFLADPGLGGIGGRDFVWEQGRRIDGAARDVGRIQWFGRMIGNHHLGVGAARTADVLKGVNMAFRRPAIANIRFDTRLKGEGAQVHLEVGFCAKLKKSGWRLIYDPAIAVDHYPAVRHDRDRRDVWDAIAAADASHNETLTLLEFLPASRRFVFLLWAVAVGTRAAPGLLQGPRLWLMGLPRAPERVIAGLRGRFQGWRTWRKSGRPA